MKNLQKELIQSGTNKNGIKAILVPTDFSENSDTALKTAIDIAKQQNAKIYLLSVAKAKGLVVEKVKMQGQIDKFHDAKLIEIIQDIRMGDPYEEILRVQAEKKIDLTIIAMNSNTKLSNIRSGNLARKVIKGSRSSTLVVGD